MTSGLGLAERRSYVMIPPTPKKEEEVAGSIEKWEQDLRELEELEAAESGNTTERLPERYTIVALERLMTPSLREFVAERRSNGELQGYDTLRNAMMSWAIRQRQDWNREHASNAMDIGALEAPSTDNSTPETPGEDTWQAINEIVEAATIGDLTAMTKR